MRIGVPDLISNSYFPAVAAGELGFFKAEGVDAELLHVYPMPKMMEALRVHIYPLFKYWFIRWM